MSYRSTLILGTASQATLLHWISLFRRFSFMARYDYHCSNCNITFEVEHPMTARPTITCPNSRSKSRACLPVLQVLHLKAQVFITLISAIPLQALPKARVHTALAETASLVQVSFLHQDMYMKQAPRNWRLIFSQYFEEGTKMSIRPLFSRA